MGMPIDSSGWSSPGTVASFAQSEPNPELMRIAYAERRRVPDGVLLDIGCGAARNLTPLAREGWRGIGLDFSEPMLRAAADRLRATRGDRWVGLAQARMDALPIRDHSVDFIVAHGIWNLAGSSAEFRRAVEEGARVAIPGAALFVFTFSRHTLPPDATPLSGESFVFSQFSGQPQCFLAESELVEEMARAGFVREPAMPVREYNRRRATSLQLRAGPPVIYEALFRYFG